MSISIKIGGSATQEEPISLSLNVRKTIDGNIMILDHSDVDIVIVTEIKKIIAFAKSSFHDKVYSVQDRLFNFLASKGVIKRETVHAGNVFGSMEASFPEAVNGASAVQLVLFSIGKFIEEEKPHMEFEQHLEDEFEKQLTEPVEEDSTELGEVPHAARKGTIDPQRTRRYQSVAMGY